MLQEVIYKQHGLFYFKFSSTQTLHSGELRTIGKTQKLKNTHTLGSETQLLQFREE